MTKIFERQEFECFYDQNSGARFEDLEFRRCKFVSSAISITRNPLFRSTVRNVTLIQCEEAGCTLDAGIFEEILVDGLKTHGLLQTWGAVFKHVTLKGKIGRVMISPFVATARATPEQQRAFDDANAEYYSRVDWALDITQGEFEECEIQRVPARLIRRDPEISVVVTREKAMEGRWRQLDLVKTHWATSLEFMLDRGDRDVTLVAPKRNRKFRQLLDGLKALQDAGVAEAERISAT